MPTIHLVFSPPWVTRLRDPRYIVQLALGPLVVLNLIAAWFVFQPLGGSAADLNTELSTLRTQTQRQQVNLARLRALVAKVEGARTDQEQFVDHFFMDRRTASSTILNEIGAAAKSSGLSPKEHTFTFEPIEGSDVFSMMSITANYEGSYADLVKFVHFVDQSSHFLIIEDVAAAPQQEGGVLSARFRINTFIRENAGKESWTEASAGGSGGEAGP